MGFLAWAILAPVVTTFWFTVLGGSGLAYEIANPGVITDAFGNFDLPALISLTLLFAFSGALLWELWRLS